MSRTNRDRIRARKKTGNRATQKRKQRKRKRNYYVGYWEITFNCGKIEHIPLANYREIKEVAQKAHLCSDKDCKPIAFKHL